MLINKGLIFGLISRKEESSGGSSSDQKIGTEDYLPFGNFSGRDEGPLVPLHGDFVNVHHGFASLRSFLSSPVPLQMTAFSQSLIRSLLDEQNGQSLCTRAWLLLIHRAPGPFQAQVYHSYLKFPSGSGWLRK